jgi:hypothetical protein
MSQYPQPPQQYQMSPEQDLAYQIRQDGEYLQILSVLYYVMTGLTALGGCIPTIYMFIGMALLGGASAGSVKPNDQAGMAIAGGVITAITGLISLIFWVFAYCLYLTGRYLSEGRSPTFCFINACLICMSVPFGTALGVFTIIVLNRPTVKARFEGHPFGRWQPPPEKKPPPFPPYG